LNEALRLIRPGGVIAGDNAMAFGKLTDKISKDRSGFCQHHRDPWIQRGVFPS